MLPTNLTPLEVIDLGIHGETLAYRMYDALVRVVHVPTLQTRLSQLKKDEKDHRKTLRAHRRALFPDAVVSVTEEDAQRIFGTVDTSAVRDKDSLIQVLYGAIRFEEYVSTLSGSEDESHGYCGCGRDRLEDRKAHRQEVFKPTRYRS